jgi:hypothetical protein
VAEWHVTIVDAAYYIERLASVSPRITETIVVVEPIIVSSNMIDHSYRVIFDIIVFIVQPKIRIRR